MKPAALRRGWTAVFAVVAASMVAPDAPAAPPSAVSGPIHRELLKTSEGVANAKGPEVYAALRDLWRTWDRADPAHVEEAIASVASSGGVAAPVKVYSELLLAYA